MALYTYGGTPADVLTTRTGDVVPDYPVIIRRAGTGERVTALFEADGTTPIGELRTNGASHPQLGAVRTFKVADVSEIEYEYLDAQGNPVRWYQAGREVSAGALAVAEAALAEAGGKLDLDTPDPQGVQGPVTFAGPVTFEQPISAPNSGDQSASRWFIVTGAAGDGVADDRPAIQAQLDAARDAGGGIVVVPGGRTYGVGTFLVVHSNTVLWAYGATIRAIGNTGLLRNFITGEEFAGYGGRSRIAVLGGVWDGNAADGVTGTVTSMTNVLSFVHCSDITVRDATIRNTSSAHGLEFNSTDGGRVINCRFEGFRDNSGDGSRQFAEAVQIDLAKSGSSSIGLFDNTPSRNITVHGCYFGPSARLGPPGRAVGSHTTVAGVYYDNITVTGCRIDGALQEGVHGYAWRRCVIADNTITGTGLAGIKVTVPDPASAGYALTPHSINVHGNVIESNTTEAAVQVAGYATALMRGVVIAGNTSRSSGSVGLRAEYCTAPVVDGNNIDSPSGTGILAQFGSDAVLSGNSVRSSGSNALNITGSPGAAVTGNMVNGTASNFGIFLGSSGSASATDALVSGNLVTAAASAGIRCSAGAARCTITSNKVRKGSGSTTNAISLAADATGCVIAGNDFTGSGWTAATAFAAAAGSAPKLDFAGGVTAPGHNLVG